MQVSVANIFSSAFSAAKKSPVTSIEWQTILFAILSIRYLLAIVSRETFFREKYFLV
jgi:hypothetical protein